MENLVSFILGTCVGVFVSIITLFFCAVGDDR